MKVSHRASVLGLVALALAGCAPAGAPAGTTTRAEGSPAPTRTAVLMTQVEPTTLSSLDAFRGTASVPAHLLRLFGAGLTLGSLDDGVPAEPYLVEQLPQINTDTWRVFPDGRMETTFVLRPGLTWHDGAPLTADDFVFAWEVLKAPAYGVSEVQPTSYVDSVSAPDPRTFVIQWKNTYVNADTLRGGERWGSALPRHILGEAFLQQKPDQFAANPYFTSQYVGAGPYRLDRWERGAFIEGSAFDGHALGRPRIERVKAIFVGDPNAAVTNLLAGGVDMAIDFSLGFEQTTILREKWVSQNAGTVVQTPDKLRYVGIEFKPEYTNPIEILDLRVRQAFWAAMDQGAFIEALLDGRGSVAQTGIPPSVPFAAAMERAITKRPYDPPRAHQLLADAGLVRGADSLYRKAAGQRFSVELRATAGGQTGQEAAILADQWRRLGVDVAERYLSDLEDADRVVRSTYPAFATANSGFTAVTVKLWSANIATEANRYSGTNRGGYSNSEFDRFYRIETTSLQEAERNEATINLMRIVNADVPILPLYFNDRYGAYSAALAPPPNASTAQIVGTGLIHQWEWR